MLRLFNKLERKVISLALVSAIGAGFIAFLVSSKETKIQEINTQINKATRPNKKISELLSTNGFRLLSKADKKDKQEWSNNWDKFKEKFANETPKNFWNFSNWQELKVMKNVPTKFKTKCETNAKKNVESEKKKIYKEVENFCATKIIDALEK